MTFYPNFNSFRNMKLNFLLLISLLLVNISFQNSVQCDGKTIDQCTKCDTGEKSDTCSVCEDGTFLFFHNLFCLPCNDSMYGQEGCGGNCDGTNFLIYRNVSCEKGGCDDGYYRTYEGKCVACGKYNPNCTKCSYEIPENETIGQFKCLECDSDEFIIDQFGRCNNCTMDLCNKCVFDENKTKVICEECAEGTELNINGECDYCYNTYKNFKECYVCEKIDKPFNCTCNYGYIENPLDPDSPCLECPYHCKEDCIFNNETNTTSCGKCEEGYSLNSEGICDYCGSSCLSCEFDENNSPKCLNCSSGYYLNKENQCSSCSYGCASCEVDENDVETCSSCIEGYAFDKEKKCHSCGYSCISCELDESGNTICLNCSKGSGLREDKTCQSCYEGCSSCYYFIIEEGEEDFNCTECEEGYTLSVGKSQECIKCPHDCDICEIGPEGNPKCLNCSDRYTLTPNGKCVYCGQFCTNCGYDENDNPVCLNCSSGYAVALDKKCQQCEDYCQECEIDEKGNSSCLKCDYGFAVNPEKKCERCQDNCQSCEFDEKGNSLCLECSYNYLLSSNKSCINCGPHCYSGDCSLDENDNPICSDCYSGSVLYKGQCHECPDECSKCEYDESSGNTKCNSCSYRYALNTDDGTCHSCSALTDTGEGCYTCEYNNASKKYECLTCGGSSNFIYINDTKKCLDISDEEKNLMYLEGCSIAIFDEKENKYQCTKCQSDYIFIPNEFICKYPIDIELASSCFVAEKLKDSSEYTCTECSDGFLNITYGSTGKVNCFAKEDNYTLCLEGTANDNGENQKCLKCEENAVLNNTICNCASDSFYENSHCHKCDDPMFYNPGCNATKGCSYLINYYYYSNNLKCNECKEGYYLDSDGQCRLCSNDLPNCNKCHLNVTIGPENETISRFICDSCNPLYKLKVENTTQTCELDECKEYLEISPGCLICKGKEDEYKTNNKCETCKYGYFKTKEETCVYCRSEQYGGPACYECEYEKDEAGTETDNITCKNCYSFFNYNSITSYYNTDSYDIYKSYFTTVLSSKGKCYNCQYELFDKCLSCEFVTSDKDEEELKCNLCPPGFYLNSEGNCVDFKDQIETLPNCYLYEFNIGNYTFDKTGYDMNLIYNYESLSNLTEYNDALTNAKYPITPLCTDCEYGYLFNEKHECVPYNYDMCTGSYILEDKVNRLLPCSSLCDNYYHGAKNYIYIKLVNNSIDMNPDNYNNISFNLYYNDYISIRDMLDSGYNNTNEETKKFLLESHICINITNMEIYNRYGYCSIILYVPTNKSYVCLECEAPYVLNPENNTCFYNHTSEQSENCEYENIGTEEAPIYSCAKCLHSNQILITGQDGIKYCANSYDVNLYRCTEANITSTYYYNTIYNCTACEYGYWPYYSKYFDREICGSIFYDLEESYTDRNFVVDDDEESIPAENGVCQTGYFTPDKKECYKCDSEENGMPGCSGACSFSLNRSNFIMCESECQEGYIEVEKGICKPCNYVERGCSLCHYETSYPEDYIGVKRERRVQCDKCSNGYMQYELTGECLSCSRFGLFNCEECIKNENYSENYTENDFGIMSPYICTKCEKYHFLTSNHLSCEKCIATKAVSNNTCINCGLGVSNCRFCESNEDGMGVQCKECDEEFILNSDENICVSRKETDLDELKNCLMFKKEGDKNVCMRCKPQFSLLKEGDEVKCSYLPTLFDSNYKGFYEEYYGSNLIRYIRNDYNARNGVFMPCKEAVNLGTEENPSYSCSKCYDVFGDEDYEFFSYYYSDYFNFYMDGYYFEVNYRRYKGYMPVKINDQMTNTSYCMRFNNETENCTEATYQIVDGVEIFNCTKCMNDNILKYKKKRDAFICVFDKNSTYNTSIINNTGSKNSDEADSDNKSDSVSNESNTPAGETNETKTYAVEQNSNIPSPIPAPVPGGDTNSDMPAPPSPAPPSPAPPSPAPGSDTRADSPSDSSSGSSSNETAIDTNIDEDDYVDPNAGKCFVEYCSSCLSDRSYFCSVCNTNYQVNKASGSCEEIYDIPPAISFVDIFGYSQRRTKIINGRSYTGPSLRLRGLTCSRISSKHAFTIILVFILSGRYRNLADNTLRIPAICEALNAASQSSDSLNSVDFDCIGRKEVPDNYKLSKIEGDNIDDELLEKIDDITMEKSNVVTDNYIIFTINNVANITSNTNKFKFNFEGTLVDKNNKLSDTNNVELEIKDRTEKAFCDFTKGSNQNANLDCALSLKGSYIIKNNMLIISRKLASGVTELAFKDNLIKINNNNVYVNRLNEVKLIQDPNYVQEENNVHVNYKKSGSSHKALIITLSIVIGVIVIGIVVAIAVYLAKKKPVPNVTQNSTANSMTIENFK